jgi:hypothetical protein
MATTPQGAPYVLATDTVTSYPTTSLALAQFVSASPLLGYGKGASIATSTTATPVDIPGATCTFTLTKPCFAICILTVTVLSSGATGSNPRIVTSGFDASLPWWSVGVLGYTAGPGQAFGGSVAYKQLATGTYTVKAQVHAQGANPSQSASGQADITVLNLGWV